MDTKIFFGDIWDTSDLWRSPCGQIYSPAEIRATWIKSLSFFPQNLAHFLTFLTLFTWNLWVCTATEYFLWLYPVFGASHTKSFVSLIILKNFFLFFWVNYVDLASWFLACIALKITATDLMWLGFSLTCSILIRWSPPATNCPQVIKIICDSNSLRRGGGAVLSARDTNERYTSIVSRKKRFKDIFPKNASTDSILEWGDHKW